LHPLQPNKKMRKILTICFVVASYVAIAQNYKFFKDGPTYKFDRPEQNFYGVKRYYQAPNNRGQVYPKVLITRTNKACIFNGITTVEYPYVTGLLLPVLMDFCNGTPINAFPDLNAMVKDYDDLSSASFLHELYLYNFNGSNYDTYDYVPSSIGTFTYKEVNRRVWIPVCNYNIRVLLGNPTFGKCNPNNTNCVTSTLPFMQEDYNFFQSLYGTATNWNSSLAAIDKYKDGNSYSINVVDFAWSNLPTEICLNAAPIDLRNYIGSNEGFTGAGFSGPGVNNYTFNPSIAGVGTWTLRATKTYDNGTATKDIQIVVNDYNRESYFDVSTITFCSDKQVVNLDTVTKGHPNGVWSGIGILDDKKSVNITDASIGATTPINKTYTYAWTNAKGCTNSQDYTLTIAPSFIIPVIKPKEVCNNASVNLSLGVTPTGGTWTSSDALLHSKIIGTTINANGLTGGNAGSANILPLKYTVNKLGCIKTEPTSIVVLRADVITTNYPKNTGGYGNVRSTTCNDLTNYNIMNGVNPKRGKWSWTTPSSDIKSVLTRDSILNTIRLDSVYTKTKADANCGPQPCEFRATYTVTNGNNCPSEVSVIFFVNKRPAPPVTTGASACVPPTASQSFTVSASALSVGNNTLLWYSKVDTAKANVAIFTGDKNQLTFNTPTVDTTTSYYARNKDQVTGCFSAYDTAITTVNTIPTVFAGRSQKICQNVSSLQLDDASATIGSKLATGKGVWGGLPNVTANGVFTNSFLPLGSYIVNYTYTTTANCSASAPKTVTVVDYPRVVVGQENFVCGNIGSYKLNGRGESPTGGTWSILNTKFAKFLRRDSLLIDSLPAMSTQNLKYTFTNSDNCTNSATRSVTLYEVPTKPSLVSGKVCGEGAVSLTALNAKSSENYMWYDSLTTKIPFNQTANFTSPSLLQSRYYFVSKKNLSSCEGKRDSVLAKVVAFTPVTVNGGEEIQVCKSANNTNLGSLVNPKKGKFSFSGISMLNDTVLVTSTANIGLYPFSYSFVNLEGCTTKVDNNVRVSLNPTLILQNDTVICKATKSFVLKTNVSGGKWSGSVAVDSVGNFDPTKLTTSGNYNLNYVFNKFGCNVSGSTKVNLVDRPLTPLISGVASGCENDSLIFTASSNENGVKFNFYRNTDSIPFSNAIISKVKNTPLLNKVSVESVNNFGCVSLAKAERATEVFTISGDFTANPTVITQGELVRFASSVNTSSNDQIKSYDWNFGDSTTHDFQSSANHYYLDSLKANITLLVTTEKGCRLKVSKPKLVQVKFIPINVRTAVSGAFQENYSLYDENTIRFFPNPVNNTLHMSAYNALSFISVQILNNHGYEILNAQYLSVNELSFDLTNQPSGLYFVIIKDGKGATINHKIVKQ